LQLLGLAEVNTLGYKRDVYKHLRRLERVWIGFSIYYVTTCTRNRKSVRTNDEAARILVEEWRAAHMRHSWAVGRYVIMPDHVHFFCRGETGAKALSDFVGNWKSWTSRAINALCRPRSAPAATTLCNASFSITFCVRMNAMRKNGTMFRTIPFMRVSSSRQAIDHLPAKSKC